MAREDSAARRTGKPAASAALRDEEILHLAVDPRAGGGFSCKLEQDDEVVEHTGKYLEVVRPRRLAFSWMVEGGLAGSRV